MSLAETLSNRIATRVSLRGAPLSMMEIFSMAISHGPHIIMTRQESQNIFFNFVFFDGSSIEFAQGEEE